jgi:hypothetical protein
MESASAGALAAAAPAPVAADRAVAKAKVAAPSKDLVALSTAKGSAGAGIASMSADELPDALQGKSAPEQKAIVDDMKQKREKLDAKIADLEQKRDANLAAQRKAQPTATKDSFDSQVVDMIQAQGKKVGLTY